MVSLNLKLVKPLAISTLIAETSSALQEILRLSFTPIIVAEEYVNQKRIPLRSEEVRSDSGMLFLEILNEPEVVSIVTFEVEHPLLSDEEQGAFIGISANTWRTPLEDALAAAVAVAFARKLGTVIEDNACVYSPVLSQSAESFIDAVKVKEPFDDYRVAAQRFYEALPQALERETGGHPIT
jgi:hypothetical protein